MSWIEALILGVLQGITEFLPISSSGHLVLGEEFLGLEVEMLKSFDVVVHLGTLLAILVYFKRDVLDMLMLRGEARKFILPIIIGTIPAVIVGFTLEDWIDGMFRNVVAVALWMILVGLVFVAGEFWYKRREKRELDGMKWHTALIIGCAQACALIPGVSRSGSTIVAGLFHGIKREEAARFSFLLGIPAIAGAGLLTALKIPGEGGLQVGTAPLLIGFVSSFVFGLLSVWFLMKFLKKNSLHVFAIYLLLAGTIVSLNFL